MSNPRDIEARELAERILKILTDREPALVYTALLYTTISVGVHQAKSVVGEGKISWPDQFRVVMANYNQQLKQHSDRTAATNDTVSSGVITSLTGMGFKLPPSVH